MRFFEDFSIGTVDHKSGSYVITEAEIIGIVSSRGEMLNQRDEVVFSLENAAMVRCRPEGPDDAAPDEDLTV